MSRGRHAAVLAAWAPAAAWMLLIFVLSDQPDLPSVPGGTLDFLLKKSMHAAGYGVLAVLLWRALRISGVRRAMPWAFALTVIYAVSDEWHQSWVEGRSGRAADVVIDAAGAALALLALHLRQ